jgi:hypothetical protein
MINKADHTFSKGSTTRDGFNSSFTFSEKMMAALNLYQRFVQDRSFLVASIIENNPDAVAANLREMGIGPFDQVNDLKAAIYKLERAGNTVATNYAIDVDWKPENASTEENEAIYQLGQQTGNPKFLSVIGDVLSTGGQLLGGDSYLGSNTPPPPPPPPPKPDYTPIILAGLGAILVLVLVMLFWKKK